MILVQDTPFFVLIRLNLLLPKTLVFDLSILAILNLGHLASYLGMMLADPSASNPALLFLDPEALCSILDPLSLALKHVH